MAHLSKKEQIRRQPAKNCIDSLVMSELLKSSSLPIEPMSPSKMNLIINQVKAPKEHKESASNGYQLPKKIYYTKEKTTPS